MNLSYLLPSLGAFIGVFSVLLTYFCLWKTLKKSKKKILQRFKEILQGEIYQDLLEEKLTEFMNTLRNQIPMGSMLLTPALSGKIKEIVREEVMKMLPDIKERIFQRLTTKISIEKTLWHLLRKELVLIIIYAGLFGFLMSLLWIFFE